MKPRLHNKVALVTGAGRGIGKAMALGLAAEGAKVVLASRTQRQIQTLARRIEKRGGTALPVTTDVCNHNDIARLVATIARDFRRLDILINNAGVFQIRTLEETTEELWDTMINTNLKGAFLVSRAALPYLKRSRGHIVNIGSVASRQSFVGSSAYCASKWGLLGLTNVMRDELAPEGIRVTSVFPSAVDTPIWKNVPGDWNRQEMMSPNAVSKAVIECCCNPKDVAVDEIVLRHNVS